MWWTHGRSEGWNSYLDGWNCTHWSPLTRTLLHTAHKQTQLLWNFPLSASFFGTEKKNNLELENGCNVYGGFFRVILIEKLWFCFATCSLYLQCLRVSVNGGNITANTLCKYSFHAIAFFNVKVDLFEMKWQKVKMLPWLNKLIISIDIIMIDRAFQIRI